MSVAEVMVSDECERKNCSQPSQYVYVVTGPVGKDGLAAYCPFCADNVIDQSENHTAVGEVKE